MSRPVDVSGVPFPVAGSVSGAAEVEDGAEVARFSDYCQLCERQLHDEYHDCETDPNGESTCCPGSCSGS